MTEAKDNNTETHGESLEEPTISGEQPQAPEPWAPEGADRIGAPPVNGEGGERGSSAYDGDGATDERGPLRGVEYHEHASELGTGITEHQQGAATADA